MLCVTCWVTIRPVLPPEAGSSRDVTRSLEIPQWECGRTVEKFKSIPGVFPRVEDGGLEGDSPRSIQHVWSQQVDPCINTCLSAGGTRAGRMEKSKCKPSLCKEWCILMKTETTEANSRCTIPGWHRPPSSSYCHACPPLSSDGALGQSGKRQHNQSKQAAWHST